MRIGDILFGMLHPTDGNVQLINTLEEAISPKIHYVCVCVFYKGSNPLIFKRYMCVCVCVFYKGKIK